MKKKAFLAPLAVSVAVLLTAGNLQATPTAEIVSVKSATEITGQIAPIFEDAFVIERADGGGVLMAGHSSHVSHVSHASHISHTSHSSHYSSSSF